MGPDMENVQIRPMGPHDYAVIVTEGPDTTHHKVHVPPQLVDDIGLPDVDEERLVAETLAFLLEREPGDAITREFDLGSVEESFPEYLDELRTRLA